MNRLPRTPLRTLAALAATAAFALGACGSDEPIVADDEPTTTQASDDNDDGNDTTDGSATDGSATDGGDSGEEARVIGTANLNGEVIDPKPHPIDDIAIAESYPEQLMVGFTAGAEPCLAADARAEVVGDEVVVTLEVGINVDAAATTCEAGEFPHTLSIALEEGLDGRQVVPATP